MRTQTLTKKNSSLFRTHTSYQQNSLFDEKRRRITEVSHSSSSSWDNRRFAWTTSSRQHSSNSSSPPSFSSHQKPLSLHAIKKTHISTKSTQKETLSLASFQELSSFSGKDNFIRQFTTMCFTPSWSWHDSSISTLVGELMFFFSYLFTCRCGSSSTARTTLLLTYLDFFSRLLLRVVSML